MQIKTLSKTENIVKEMTVGFLLRGDEVLLGYKKRGYGVGKYSGVGGKLEKGETFDQCMIRETLEEIKVNIRRLKKVGNIRIYDKTDIFGLHIYNIDEWSGTPQETEEIKPEWFKLDKIPFNRMWSDDSLWLRQTLNGAFVTGTIHHDEQGYINDLRFSKRM